MHSNYSHLLSSPFIQSTELGTLTTREFIQLARSISELGLTSSTVGILGFFWRFSSYKPPFTWEFSSQPCLMTQKEGTWDSSTRALDTFGHHLCMI